MLPSQQWCYFPKKEGTYFHYWAQDFSKMDHHFQGLLHLSLDLGTLFEHCAHKSSLDAVNHQLKACEMF